MCYLRSHNYTVKGNIYIDLFRIGFVIQVEALTKSFGGHNPPAVKDATFNVESGEILGFAGLNGAGKTTTIRAICGVTLPTSGTILVDGHDIAKDKINASKNIGWVPEFPNFDPNAKPVPLLRYYAGFYGIKGEESKKVAMDLLGKVELTGSANRKLRTYSQGMKKRFALASAMLSDPANYLFDETLNGLDPEGMNFARHLMTRLKDEGKAVFLSSHILSELENLADRILVIHKGEIIETLTRDRIRRLGKPVLKLRIDKVDSSAISLLEQYGKVRVDGDTVTVMDLSSGKESADDVNSELVKRGYRVTMFNLQGASLEEYFFELVRSKK